jgi:GNAT superfamily N-acetyltransferase
MSTIEQISWEEIYSIWNDHLWPERKTEIKPTNGIKLMGGFDKSIEDNIPTFFGLFLNDQLAGVNSGYATSSIEYRSRGLYIFPEFRGMKLSMLLLKAVENQAIKESKSILWSMPRESAVHVYLKFGFQIVSDFFGDMEFGPNCFVVKYL